MSDLDFDGFDALTFDCYGTLIDWETGILTALRPVLLREDVEISDGEILERYGRYEAEAERGTYLPYREVLREVLRRFGEAFGFAPGPAEVDTLPDSLRDWPPFPDTVEALRALKRRYRLGVISNVDDDLFALSARHLRVEWDWIVTAQQVGSYKPSHRNFEAALERIGLPTERILHVAQSLYHDIVPARALGLSTVWVNRRAGQEGSGATVPAEGQPDLEVPDLASLVRAARITAP